MTRKFYLEIYDPDSAEEVADNFASDAPFQPMHVGDLITMDGHSGDFLYRVERIEHIILNKGLTWKICVFTSRIPNTSEARCGAT